MVVGRGRGLRGPAPRLSLQRTQLRDSTRASPFSSPHSPGRRAGGAGAGGSPSRAGPGAPLTPQRAGLWPTLPPGGRLVKDTGLWALRTLLPPHHGLPSDAPRGNLVVLLEVTFSSGLGSSWYESSCCLTVRSDGNVNFIHFLFRKKSTALCQHQQPTWEGLRFLGFEIFSDQKVLYFLNENAHAKYRMLNRMMSFVPRDFRVLERSGNNNKKEVFLGELWG